MVRGAGSVHRVHATTSSIHLQNMQMLSHGHVSLVVCAHTHLQRSRRSDMVDTHNNYLLFDLPIQWFELVLYLFVLGNVHQSLVWMSEADNLSLFYSTAIATIRFSRMQRAVVVDGFDIMWLTCTFFILTMSTVSCIVLGLCPFGRWTVVAILNTIHCMHYSRRTLACVAEAPVLFTVAEPPVLFTVAEPPVLFTVAVWWPCS